MFYSCSALTTIYASDKFVTDKVTMVVICSLVAQISKAIAVARPTTPMPTAARMVILLLYLSMPSLTKALGTLTFRRGLSKPEGAYDA